MKAFRHLQFGSLLVILAAAPLAAQVEGKGKPGGGGGTAGVALETTHFEFASPEDPFNIHWSGTGPISQATDGHEVTFDKNGTYKLTMQCANPGDCQPRSFVISLTPVLPDDCPAIDWLEARMSMRVDNVESVDYGTVARNGWAQIRQLIDGEAVDVLYTLNWDGQDGADLLWVTGDGGASWTVESGGMGLASMRVPAEKGNKTVVCGLVEASFAFETHVAN